MISLVSGVLVLSGTTPIRDHLSIVFQCVRFLDRNCLAVVVVPNLAMCKSFRALFHEVDTPDVFGVVFFMLVFMLVRGVSFLGGNLDLESLSLKLWWGVRF